MGALAVPWVSELRKSSHFARTFFLTLGGKSTSVRSDVDMFSYSFRWRPWNRPQVFGSGEAIMEYLHETVDEFDLGKRIRFGHEVFSAAFCSEKAQWTLTTSQGTFTSRFLFMGAGYYQTTGTGHVPTFAKEGNAERDRFIDTGGQVVHAQFWPKDLDFAGKTVAVVGSGSGAISMVPTLAESAEKVTVIQRSPSYIVPKASTPTALAKLVSRFAGPSLAAKISFWSVAI